MSTSLGLDQVAAKINEAIPRRHRRKASAKYTASESVVDAQAPHGRDSGPPIVLVIDDDPGIRELEASALRHKGYAVLEAADGVTGILNARMNVPDAVILDILMPQVDGREVLRTLKADAATAAVRIIVVSAIASSLDVEDIALL